jgi:hypothetical protein
LLKADQIGLTRLAHRTIVAEAVADRFREPYSWASTSGSLSRNSIASGTARLKRWAPTPLGISCQDRGLARKAALH